MTQIGAVREGDERTCSEGREVAWSVIAGFDFLCDAVGQVGIFAMASVNHVSYMAV